MSGAQPPRPVTEATPHGNFSRVAIVGAATLKGREIKEVLEERRFPTLDAVEIIEKGSIKSAVLHDAQRTVLE